MKAKTHLGFASKPNMVKRVSTILLMAGLTTGFLSGCSDSGVVIGGDVNADTVRDPSENSVLNPVIDPVTDPVVDPVTDPVDDPVTDPVDDPVTDPVEDPVTDPVEDPVTDPVVEPVTDPGDDPVTDPVVDPVTDPVVNPVTDPVEDPVTDPVEDPVTDPVVDPVTDPLVEPVTDPVVDPVTDPVVDPVTDPVVDPVTDPVVDPVTDPVVEPVTDPVVEPIVEPVPPISLAELGELIFNDTNLSSPAGQACASCHSEDNGFVDPDVDHPSSLAANGGDFGIRNAQTLFYIGHVPDFQLRQRLNPVTQVLQNFEFGGFFVDGRAATLAKQAKSPLFSPIEMALPSRQELATRIQQSDYSMDFQIRFGMHVFEDVDSTLYSAIGALAAYQRTERFAPFNSTFDRVKQGLESFTEAEARGKALFNGKAQCSLCHASPNKPELFSDFQYHNVGTPRNQTLLSDIGNPDFVDLGLGAITNNAANNGQFRTPTLRNVARTAPYMHNGVFNTLREVVLFYNSGAEPREVPGTNIRTFIGNLGLNAVEVDDLVAFLKSLTDH